MGPLLEGSPRENPGKDNASKWVEGPWERELGETNNDADASYKFLGY